MESPFAAKATDSPSRNLFPLPSATLCYQINRADVFQLFQYSTQDLAEYVGNDSRDNYHRKMGKRKVVSRL